MYDPLGGPNILQRRKQQLEAWNESDTNKQTLNSKDPERVKFPDPVQFWAACSSLDYEEADRILDLGVNVNVAKSDGLTALHQACIDNAYDMVKYLVDKEANVNLQDNEGWTPLHATAQCGYMEIAKLLIDRGADLSIISYDTELAVDVAQGNQMVTLLREAMNEQNVDEDEARSCEHRLLLADANRWLEKGLSSSNAVLSNPDKNLFVPCMDQKTRATPLHVASAKEYEDVLSVLVKIPNIDIDVQDIDGWTPLHAAVHWGKEQSIRILVDANASIEITTLAVSTCKHS
ncbi:Ankyrin-2 [Cichlidogyrus casuarinus]|uniref:Ankyrin-2 n=1 Tax=Cichlidogyrus casuarinus TaxID=1844966 RepID=A0ABD2PRV8_9PLAT